MHSPDNGGRVPQRKIGDILLAEGMISQEQLDEALEMQKTDDRYLGKILISLSHLSQEDLALALATRLSMEYVTLSEVKVDPEVVGIIDEEILRQHKAVPIKLEDGRLVVAMSEPNDIYAKSDLTISAGYPVTPVIAAEDAVHRLQDQIFSDVGSVPNAVAQLAQAVEASRTVTAEPERVESGPQPEVDLAELVEEPAPGPERDAPATNGDRNGSCTGVKIEDILLEEGKITEEQLEQALAMQKNDPRDLGKILLSLGYVIPADLARALARRLRLDYVVISELPEGEVDPSALDLFGEGTLRKYTALPLRFEGDNLVVAMSNPDDISALEDLKLIAGCYITPVIATEEDLNGAFSHLFGGGVRADGSEDTGRVADGQVAIREEGSEKGGLRLKVLVAEDDAVARRIAGKTIERFGHEYLMAEDGLTAWKIYQETPDINVVLSDWMMPGIHGLELCRRVRGLERERHTFFIFLTALRGEKHLLEGMRAGADEYLTKPLDREHLRSMLENVVRVNSAQDHLRAIGGPENGKGTPPGAGSRALVRTTDRALRKKGGGKVWEVLLSQGKLSEEQLEQALELQKTDRRELGGILLSLGYIDKMDLAQATAQRLRLDFVEITERDVDRTAASLVEQKVLRRYGVLPLRVEGGRLVVAMSDPTNIYALEDLRMISGHPVAPVVALEDEIRRVHNKIFAMSEEISEFLEEASKETVEQDHGDLELGVEASPDEAPIIRLVSSILQQAVGDGASDIHIEPQARELAVRMRVDGVLREAMTVPLKLQNGVIARLKILANLDIAEKRIPQDGRFSVKLGGQKLDLRVASLPTVYGEKIVLRLLDTSNASVELTKLGFPPKVYARYEEIFRRPYGAILVTGPTGSGKSTSLYATLNELNSPEKNIITVEDPVEYRMRGINQIQTNPKAGLTFASALKSILRADPDIVMIGEIRNFETAKIAVEAALTGHLVLATLHTNDAPGALSRLTDMGVEPFLSSSAVDCVIAQRLARRLCAGCKEPVEIEKDILESMRFPFKHLSEGASLDFHKAVGCGKCGGSGYKGRVGIYELMVVDEKIKAMILRRQSTGEIGQAAEEDGMVRLRDDGLLKASEGLTTIEEILRTVV